jgi:hypothetical protein
VCEAVISLENKRLRTHGAWMVFLRKRNKTILKYSICVAVL